jgi:two-component system OmpR family response regulator
LDHDPLEQTFFLRGEPLYLTRQEYKLLRFLVEHPRQLLSQDQLLQGAWEDALDSDSDALHSCVYRLRRCLGPVAACMIQTQRGSGYRFIPEPRRS